jgi:hypothetical protein
MGEVDLQEETEGTEGEFFSLRYLPYLLLKNLSFVAQTGCVPTGFLIACAAIRFWLNKFPCEFPARPLLFIIAASRRFRGNDKRDGGTGRNSFLAELSEH